MLVYGHSCIFIDLYYQQDIAAAQIIECKLSVSVCNILGMGTLYEGIIKQHISHKDIE
jgi:hypothetical protein